ncbi:hypothetical protein [Leucobacter sp. M11]|uniref:hypothetical protein n=1 Tax=Leucobacter sp. M11 TaxID=2993565 RepID=UPI002D801B9A|nr:hypothetical protein [Leucobacter sp. M11]MEB4616045.1 hypothetical protein [Leucobacter sp. M11]
MKALFGLAQIGLFIFGIFEAVQGRWWMLLLCWAGAALIGFIGARTLRNPNGLSQFANSGMTNMNTAGKLIDQGNYPAAGKSIRLAVRDFRTGNDYGLLAVALPMQAIIDAHLGETESALTALDHAQDELRKVHSNAGESVIQMQTYLSELRAEIRSGNRDAEGMFLHFTRFQENLTG